jgi:hypothetical protein
LHCSDRREQDGGEAHDVLVGKRVGGHGRVLQQYGSQCVHETVRVGGAHPAGPVVHDLQDSGVLVEEVRVEAVER